MASVHEVRGKRNNQGHGGEIFKQHSVGETVGVRLRKILTFLGTGFAALCLLLLSGCGGKGNAANVVTVSVIPSPIFLILGQSQTLTATVNGATNTNVTWSPCQYTTTTTTNGKATTSDPKDCPSDGSFGTLSNQQATGTATYTAPDPAKFQLPDQTKFPGLQIVITATSVQDTKKSGKANITLISGIKAALTPLTASVPTKELQQFSALLTNDIQNKGVTWLLTQNIPSTTNGVTTKFPDLPSCSPSCGKITPDANNPNVAVYTAPDSVPTAISPAQTSNTNPPADVTIVATPVADNLAFVIGTITIVAGGPITFNGITPTIAPLGGTLWDIYLDAPNISSSSIITLTDANGGTVRKDSTSGQIKILFPVSTSTTKNPSSTGARLRLDAADLGTAGPITVSVTDPAQPVTAPNPPSSYTFNVIPVRPTSVASVPDDVVQGKLSQDTRVIIDGGYFGPSGNLATVFFQGNAIQQDPNRPSTSRQLDTLLLTSQINSGNPGLYPLSVASRATPPPSPNNPAVSNIAVFPDYSVTPPAVPNVPNVPSSVAAGTNPSAVDIDPTLGVLVVAETGSNAVQFYNISKQTDPISTRSAYTLIPIDASGNPCTPSPSLPTCPYTSVTMSTPSGPATASMNLPTGVSVNRSNHTVAVVNYGTQTIDSSGTQTISGQTVMVLPIPVPGASPQPPAAPGTPFFIDISGAFQGQVKPAPMPYAIGVDPDSNLALVAYSSTSTSSSSNLGFLLNLNPNTADANGKPTNPYGCALGQAINSASNAFGQCLFAQVTLNTGVYPQIAMASHGHLALVTPGGSGVVRGVDVTKPSTSNTIASSTMTAGLITVTIASGQTLSMVPGNAGTVLIAGVKPGNTANDSFFNGVFSVSVTSSNSFTYAVNSTASDSGSAGTVFYSGPVQLFPISATTQGVAINPITRTAAIADTNSTGTNGPQIDLLSGLDQSISSITFHAACTAFVTSCSSSPELLGTTDVAWQPYTNALVSYNPQLNQVSVSDPVSRQRYAFACASPAACQVNPIVPSQITLSGSGTATLTAQTVPPVQNGTTNSLTLFGGLAVDPVSNQAFVVKSGSGSIDIVDLGGPGTATPIKSAHVSELIVPSPTSGVGVIGGIPNALVPQATLTCSTPVPPATSCDLPGVQVFGAGFDATTQVRLDSVSIPPSDIQFVSERQLTVTIPASFRTFPHRFALDVINGKGVQSNATDFIVIQAVDMSRVCTDANGNSVNTLPTSVALADQLANGPFAPIAIISNNGCNSLSVIDINPASPTFGQLMGSPISVGTAPQGIAISQHLGLAVVANHGSNDTSIIDLTKNPPVQKVPNVATGTNPTGVAINDATGAAIVANTGSNTVSMIDLGQLFPPAGTTPPTTLTPVSIGGIQQPIAVAIDPDRGTNNQGIAVVTGVQLNPGAAPSGALAVVEIGVSPPTLSSTVPSGTVTGTPTGIVFDPATNPGVFFANSSGANVISEFNPDIGGGQSVNVGINPTSLAINSQTGAILTANSASNTISIVDTLSNPFKTRQTLGIPGSPTFGVAIDQFTNLAVIVDQANMRVLLFPMPN